MEYNIAARPTTYMERVFRSRLEAHWAAFFDCIGFKYDYEPCDFEGWSPDFLVRGKASNLFCEVKPFINDEVKAEYLIKINRAMEIKEGYPACILLDNFTSPDYYSSVLAGYQVWDKNSYIACHWKVDQKGHHTTYDIGSEQYDFTGLLWEDQTNRKWFATKSFGYPMLKALWNIAGNKVKFEIN